MMDDLQTHSDPGIELRLEKIQHFLDIERYDLAERELRGALSAYPEEPLLHVQLGWALEGLGRTDEAEEEGRTALKLDPQEVDALILLARLSLNAGRHREAEELCLSALKIDPMSPQSYLIYGILMHKTGHLDKAEKLVRKCLEIAPEYPESHSILSIILAERRKTSPAVAHGTHGVALNPDNDNSHAMLGYTYLATGHPFKARSHLREALRIDPGNLDVEEAFQEADRATRWIYLPMYFWTLLIERLPGRQFAVWIGMVILLQLLPRAGVSAKLVLGLALTYIAFCLYTWIATPLTNAWIKIRPAK
jgi:tetratricopeptide (TPR) repeat protein